jgi:putative aminopeptidase
MRTLLVLICLLACAPLSAQRPSDAELDAIASWISLTAPTGWEHVAAAALEPLGFRRDAVGNYIRRQGSGMPRRVVACNLDSPAYAVSDIREDGWLRVHMIGSARHPLWHQSHEGQRATIITRRGPVSGVFAVRSTHIWRTRTATTALVNESDLYIDIGAENAAQARELGIEPLDPVIRDWPAWSFADYASGPAAGSRAGCAALAAAAQSVPQQGETIFILGVQGAFANMGIGGALARLGRIDALSLVGAGAAQGGTRRVNAPAYVPASTGLDSVTMITAQVRNPGALSESISRDGARTLRAIVAAAAGVAAAPAWVAVRSASPAGGHGADAVATTANALTTLADAYGVSGHEQDVRARIRNALPEWAKRIVQVDSAGNLIVAAGPERDSIAIIAHMDETGYEITNIAADGTVSLRTRGGMITTLWEGQPALLHFDDGRAPLRGLFNTRDAATTRDAGNVTAWFGMDAGALVAAGVRTGQSITSLKQATRMGATRFTARSLDDRAGSTALLLALQGIDPTKLTRKVIFAWAVREETGLEGAAAMATRYGVTVPRVYSIDTFVSSDSPLEDRYYAYAPLGGGVVHRGLDNSSFTTPAEQDRIMRIAKAGAIPLRRATTSGGTDGSTFQRYGAINAGLSWPGRYSHSPVEVLDLRDLMSLSRLIAAIALDPTK